MPKVENESRYDRTERQQEDDEEVDLGVKSWEVLSKVGARPGSFTPNHSLDQLKN